MVAYAIKDGVPIVAMLAGASAPRVPGPIYVLLQALVLLPAFGLVYAVGVSRVLGPRVVLRRSLQYALARKTLTILAVLPALALVISLVRDRSRTLGEIAMSSAALYVGLIAVLVAALRYRDRARQWLDLHFFREEYDARKILVSLASRVRFETDPADLAAMVVGQIDEALHPMMLAILVGGLEPGQLVPVTVLHGQRRLAAARRRVGRNAAVVERAARCDARPIRAHRSGGCRRTSRNGCTARARRCSFPVSRRTLRWRRSSCSASGAPKRPTPTRTARSSAASRRRWALGFDVARLRRRVTRGRPREADDAARGRRWRRR